MKGGGGGGNNDIYWLNGRYYNLYNKRSIGDILRPLVSISGPGTPPPNY